MAHISEPGGALFAALIRDLSILLIEDHVQAREVTQLLLEGLGARVVAAMMAGTRSIVSPRPTRTSS